MIKYSLMKNTLSTITDKIVSRYAVEDETLYKAKSTDINVLLNRVKLHQKKESRKKILFSAITSLSIVLFGVLIF